MMGFGVAVIIGQTVLHSCYYVYVPIWKVSDFSLDEGLRYIVGFTISWASSLTQLGFKDDFYPYSIHTVLEEAQHLQLSSHGDLDSAKGLWHILLLASSCLQLAYKGGFQFIINQMFCQRGRFFMFLMSCYFLVKNEINDLFPLESQVLDLNKYSIIFICWEISI